MQRGQDNLWVRRIGFTTLVVLTVVAWRRRDQIKGVLSPMFDSIDSLGMWAPVVLALVYIPACLLFVPNTFISPGVGFLLGPVWGTIAASVGLLLGHSSNFGVSRTLGRGWFQSRARAQKQFKAVELACQREGFKIVLLTRLTPAFPSNLMSYLFGMTSVGWRSYVIGTAIGMLPRTVLYASLGAAAGSFADASAHSFEGQPAVRYALYLGIAFTLVAVVVITRIAQRALNDALQQTEQLAPVSEASALPKHAA